MISEILAVINFIKNIVYFCFVLSYNTGKIIIHALGTTLKFTSCACTNVASILKILWEDFCVFKADVMHQISNLFLVVSAGVSNIVSSFISLVTNIKVYVETLLYTVINVFDTLWNRTFNIFAAVGQLFVFLKRLMVLFGSGIWFVVTLVPSFFVYTFLLGTYYVKMITEEILNFFCTIFDHISHIVLDMYIFVTDVPFESLAGLITGICIMYIVIKFHVTLYHYTQSKLLRLFNLITSNSQLLYLRLQKNQRVIETSESSEASDNETDCSNDHLYCIICQERNKCILLLPCKHVCLCAECYLHLRPYNRTCPICRAVVHETMKIFV